MPQDRAKSAGFTIFELLVVIGASILIAGLTVPVGVRFYQTQILDDTTSVIMTTLRRAQSQAEFQKNDSSFGVKFLTGSYVLFQGDSYAGRTISEDEIFSLSGNVNTSGVDEVVYAKLTGIPSLAGTLTVALDNDSQTININLQGKVDRE